MTSTDIGHVNPNQQRVVRRVGPSPTMPGQYTYELECQRVDDDGVRCSNRYGANGPDIDGAGAGAGRRCPACQGGRPGDPIVDGDEDTPTVDVFLSQVLPYFDEELSREEMRLELRPLHAAVRIAREYVLEVYMDGETSVPDLEELEFLTEPWFRGFYQLTEQWYRSRYGAAFDQRPRRKTVGFIVISGIPFRVDVPLNVISPDEPGKTVWLRIPDSLLPHEDVTRWLINPPNLSEMRSRERARVVRDLTEIAGLHRKIHSHFIGIASGSINRGLLEAVRGSLRTAADQVLQNWEQKGTAKAAWEMQVACECALKALAEVKTGKFRMTHDLFVLYDDVASFLDSLKRNELKKLPRWEEMADLRYGQGTVPSLDAAFRMYVTALKIVDSALRPLVIINIGQASLKIGRPPWMVPFDDNERNPDSGTEQE